MSTPSLSASSWAFFSGFTLKPMTMASDAEARRTSFTEIAPTPECRIVTLTFSVESLPSVWTRTSSEPCTSAFRMSARSFASPSFIRLKSESSDMREDFASDSSRSFCERNWRPGGPCDFVLDDLERVAGVRDVLEAHDLDGRRRAAPR